MTWYSGLEAICRPDVPLREHTWYKLGGPARWFFEPRDDAEVAAVVARCREHGVKWRVLGLGANVLVSDRGFDGAVVRLTGAHFEEFRLDDPTVLANAGVDFTKLVRRACGRGLGGLENLAGIPGTLGGIVRMNAGGRYGEVCQFVRAVRVLEADGRIVVRPADAVGFAYRRTNLAGCVVLGATLELEPGEPAALLARYREIWNNKYETQPPVSERTAGCVFKNPPGRSAGALLDQAGLKGARRGAAEISPKHANFIVAHAGASAQDVLDLIALARERVWQHAGIDLQPEVELW